MHSSEESAVQGLRHRLSVAAIPTPQFLLVGGATAELDREVSAHLIRARAKDSAMVYTYAHITILVVYKDTTSGIVSSVWTFPKGETLPGICVTLSI